MKVYKSHFLEKESDITIISESKSAIYDAKECFYYHRKILDTFVAQNPEFLNSFSPLNISTDLKIIDLMTNTSKICDVGPMATVAGAFADLMVEQMKSRQKEGQTTVRVALVENGGEIKIHSDFPIKVALFAGFNELNLNMGFLIKKEDCPIGIGTSSSTFGHAVSLGQADSVTIFAESATLADGAATSVANAVKGYDIEQSIGLGLHLAEDIEGVRGAIISRENKIGQVGKLPKIFKIEGEKQEILKNKFNTQFLGDFELIR
ncbi:MAG: UPF0280 family protein [Candidatus Thorarchaeota archaeon]